MERIECPCSRQVIEPLRLHIRDGFKVLLNLRNLSYYPEYNIPLEKVEFTMKFFTKGRVEEFIVKKLGKSTFNCSLDYSKSEVKCIFKNHGLKPGRLMVDVEVSWKDKDFLDQYNSVNLLQDLNILLIDPTE